MFARRAILPLAALILGGVLSAQAPPPPPLPPLPPPPPEASASGNYRTERRQERMTSGGRLWVRNRNGAIRVTVWDKEEVALTAQIRDSDRRRVELQVTRKGQDLEIEAQFQKPTWSFFSFSSAPSPRCELILQVPRKLQGNFQTLNGPISVNGLQGYVRAETTNGSLRLEHLGGEVVAETTNGTIDARHLTARIKGGTTNGRIILERIDGGVRMETTNGDILARDLDGWGEGISLETTHGRIEVELGRATGELRAENTHGELDVRVPGAQAVRIEKHSVHLKVPGRSSQQIKLETTTGAIRVR